MAKKQKNQKKLIITLASISVILFVICVGSIIYNFNGGFYFSRVIEYSKILGEEQTILLTGEGSSMTACNFSGTTLLGDDINQKINIKTENLSQPLYLRAKVVLVGAKEQNNIIFGFTNWVQNDDGYIYFNQTIGENEQIGLCKYVRLSTQNKLETNINYILIFVVEASSSPFVINEIS